MLEMNRGDRFAPLTKTELSVSPAPFAGPIATALQGNETGIIMPVPADASEPNFNHPHRGKPSRAWEYRDATGALLFYVCRFDKRGGKDFAQLWWCRPERGEDKWLWKLPIKTARPLYGLDRLAAAPDAQVIIVEGEKAADAAASIFPGAVAVTWPGGANAVLKADFEPLTGRKVLLWPDNDDPGRKCMAILSQHLADMDIGCEISLVDAARLAGVMPTDVSTRRTPRDKWDAADALEEWENREKLAEVILQHASKYVGDDANDADAPKTRQKWEPKMRSVGDFTMSQDLGLSVAISSTRGDDVKTKIVAVSAPFEIVGRVRDPKGLGWAKMIRWTDEDSRVHTYSVPDAALHGDLSPLIKALATEGLKIYRNTGSHFADYLNLVEVRERVTTVERTGWHEIGGKRVFVLPDETFGEPEGETVSLTNVKTAPFESRGTLDGWREGVGHLVTGQSRHVFAVSAAFVGPLLAIVDQDGGGFNFYGGSSTGKSTAIEAAASVWGKGASPGFVSSWRSTANALEASAALHAETLLALDELGVVDGKDAAAAAYQLASGTGKGRSNKDGSLRDPMTWRVSFVSTGEMTLADKLIESKQRAMAGQAVRLVDIPADVGKGHGSFDHVGDFKGGKELSDAIKRAARSSYGTAGPEFVRQLIAARPDEVAQLVRQSVEKFRTAVVPSGANGQVLRAADRFAIAAAAGEMAISFGIVPWKRGDAIAAAKACFYAWLNARGGTESHEKTEVISCVRACIEAHGASRFAQINEAANSIVRDRLGYVHGQGNKREYLIFPQMWKEEVISGHNPTAAARWLDEAGHLRRSKDGLQVKVRVGDQTLWFYAVKANILSGENGGNDVTPC